MVKIQDMCKKYSLYVKNVIKKKQNCLFDNEDDAEEDAGDDEQLIAECVDYLSETNTEEEDDDDIMD